MSGCSKERRYTEAMSAPVVPSPLDSLRGHRFVLVPPIHSGEPNDWRLGFQTWNDIQMINFQTGNEIWVSRRYLAGQCDGIDDTIPVVILKQPLRLQNGLVVPENVRVLEMPAVSGKPSVNLKWLRRKGRPKAQVTQIRAADQVWGQTRTGRMMWAVIATALVPAITYALLLR